MKRASDPSLEIQKLPTGVLSIDLMLEGGFARGRHTEIYGSYGVGKTFCTYRLIATAQAAGLLCAFFDVEGTFAPEFAAHCGVDLDNLLFPDKAYGNQLIGEMEAMLYTGAMDVMVLDSIASLLPKEEAEKSMEEGSYGTQQAKMMSAALRRLTTANRSTALIYINQMRDNIGVMFGPRSTTTGGRAMGFYAGTRIEMVRTESIKRKHPVIDPSKGDEKVKDLVVGHRVLVRVDKDKTGIRQASETSFVFNYEIGGVDKLEDLMYLGRVHGLVGKSGNSWWVTDYEEEKQASRAKFKNWLRRNVAVQEDLEERIRAAATSAASSASEDDEED